MGLAAKRIGLGLGYFSLALGALEVAAPGRLARFLGLEGSKAARNTLFAFGLREIAAGGMLLRGPAVSTNVWNRVIGDAMDAGSARPRLPRLDPQARGLGRSCVRRQRDGRGLARRPSARPFDRPNLPGGSDARLALSSGGVSLSPYRS